LVGLPYEVRHESSFYLEPKGKGRKGIDVMQLYKDYAPAVGDRKGLGLPDRQNWLVLLGKNRDSSLLEKSNFDVALEMLGGESDDVEVCRFGHWICGWIEIVIVNPESKAAKIADDIENQLEDYPALDEHDWTSREMDAHCEWVEQMFKFVESSYDVTIDRDSVDYGDMEHELDWETHEGGSTPSEAEIYEYLEEKGLVTPDE
tara:strand:+ start:822 stop:1430 length:609 start_codon:yes stop_codon:yes gene_type:complete